MYIPKSFANEDAAALHAFIGQYGFATLFSLAEGAPFATHLPLMLEAEGAGQPVLLGHMARANPQWREFGNDSEALAVFQGPHAYVSPAWYTAEKAVPTWNYTAVHALGVPHVIEDEQRALAAIKRLVEKYEKGNQPPWRMEGLPGEYLQAQLKAIVAFEMPVRRLEGKFKLSQNRSPADRRGVIAGLKETGGAEHAALARLMEEDAKE